MSSSSAPAGDGHGVASPAVAAAASLHRSLARDFNLLCDAADRSRRRAALTKIHDTLRPLLDQAKGRVAPPPAAKPKLIFSAKAMAEATAATASAPPAPAAPAAAASTGSPASLTPSQREAVLTLDALLRLPGASGPHTLLALVVQRIADETESIRAQALRLANDVVGAVGAHAPHSYLSDFLPIICARLSPSAASLSAAASFATTAMPASSAPLTVHSGIAIPAGAGALPNAMLQTPGAGSSSSAHLEPSEELRLNLLRLLVQLIECERSRASGDASASAAPSSHQSVLGSLDKLVAVVLRTVTDPFPDLKKESCQLVSVLAELMASGGAAISPTVRADAANALQRALLPNLKHQHSQVRVQALQAFGSVIRHLGGESLSTSTVESLPLLSSLLHDRTPRIREVFTAELLAWLQSLPHLLPVYQSKLIVLLLGLTADEVPSIAAKAVDAINAVGDAVQQRAASGADAMVTDSDTSHTFLTAVDATTTDASASDSTWLSPSLRSPFVSRPPAAARALLRSHANELLPMVLSDLSDWTQSKRARAAGTLKSLLVYLEDGVVPQLVTVLQALIKAVRDEESSVSTLIAQCAELLGCLVRDATIWLERMLPELERNADVNYRTSLLLVLLNLIRGMPILMQTDSASQSPAVPSADPQAQAANDAKIARVFPHLLNTLSHGDLCCSDDGAIRLQLHRILACVLSRIPRSCGSRLFADKIFHMLVQLDTKSAHAGAAAAPGGAATSGGASPSTEEERHILTSLELLARCEQQYGSLQVDASASSAALLQAVYSSHMVGELQLLLGDELVANPSAAASLLPPTWGQAKDATQLVCLTFFQLIERAAALSTLQLGGAGAGAGAAATPSAAVSSLLECHLPLLLPVLVHSARPECDSSTRSLALNFVYKLALLHSGSLLRGADASLLRGLVADVLLPNCVWRSGRVASSLRLHALTVLHALFAHSLLLAPLALQLSPQLLPLLHSNLDDDEARVRMLAVLLLQQLLTLLPPHSLRLPDDLLTELHRDLLKRLDDSHDDIRLQVVQALTLLLQRVFPPHDDYDKTDSYFRYILQCFYIYLDDSNPSIIDACFRFLQTAMNYNPKIFVQETEVAKSKQTTGHYCDQLLQAAQAL